MAGRGRGLRGRPAHRQPGLRVFDWPLLLPLGGALLWATYQILTRLAACHDPPDTSLVWTSLVALIATSFVGPIGWQWQSPLAWILMVATSAIGWWRSMP